MIKNKRLLKAVALFFAIEIFVGIIQPTVSWALTSGPTSPEASSFEPVDTTDMVNLATGDLVYNTPLFEVPGPAGGYPLSLSYHAGIQPNEEASWVGLGWTLNPGAITRSVNGFPDDQKDSPNTSRYFWKGGATETYSTGVSVGITGTPLSVNAETSFSQDTYQGFGIGQSVGIGMRIGPEGSPFGVGAQVGVSPYGQTYASVGANMSVPIGGAQKTSAGIGLGVGLTVSGGSVNMYGSAGLSLNKSKGGELSKGVGLMGVSISTDGKSVSSNLSVVGNSVANNASSNRIRTSSSGVTIPIPVYWGVAITFGYKYQRYWIDEMDAFTTSGSMYYPANATELTTHNFDNKAYDTYSLLDPEMAGGIIDNPDPEKVMGGSFPGYDHYLVHAQGLAGVMRPYMYQRHLYKRNKFTKDSDGAKAYSTIQYDVSKLNSNQAHFDAEFRFLNDFSNRFEYTPGDFSYSSNNVTPITASFSNGTNLKVGESGSSYTSNAVQGSRQITWLTNKQIETNDVKVSTAGFRETYSSGFIRPNSDPRDDDNIGGFVITNESGVKYHFALPAYTYSEYMYSENKTGTETFNELTKKDRYAYTWYLTGITGPDYVDRGPSGAPDGKLNSFDWGYWVEFEYGKWTDTYAWRNPGEGMNVDMDQNFQNFSEGIKEVYYLDAIRTRSHTALFVKDIRDDAKSAVIYKRNNDHNKIKLDANSKTGGFIPNETTCSCELMQKVAVYNDQGQIIDYNYYYEDGSLTYKTLPASSMKLTSIILLENSKAVYSKAAGSIYEQKTTYNWNVTMNTTPGYDLCDFSTVTTNYHLYQNVFDVYDLANAPTLVSNAIRKIDLITDYSLSPETLNSFDYTIVKSPSPPMNSTSYPKKGKLTLKEIQVKGKAGNGGALLPPTKFVYDLNEGWYSSVLSVENGQSHFSLSNSTYQKGDLMKFVKGNATYYAVVKSKQGNQHNIKFIGAQKPTVNVGAYVTRIKNPPYNKDLYDDWGLYKPDYVASSTAADQKFDRMVTDVSARAVDAWSLRSISTPTGAKVNLEYESDSYGRTALKAKNDLIIKSMVQNNGSTVLTLESTSVDVGSIISPNNKLDYQILFGDEFRIFAPSERPMVLPNFHNGSLVVKTVEQINGDWTITTDTNFDHFFIKFDARVPPQPGPPNAFCTGLSFVAGNLSTPTKNQLGGGLRVKSIAVKSIDVERATNYSYTAPSDPSVSSGVTSYEPIGLNSYRMYFPNTAFYPSHEQEALEETYKKNYYLNFAEILQNSREIPGPGVMYEYVTVSESVTKDGATKGLPFASIYNFEVMKDGLVTINRHDNERSADFAQLQYEGYIKFSRKESRQVTLKDFTSRVGVLKSVKLVDTQRNLTISETRNEYLHDVAPDNGDYATALDARFNSQGIVEETFTDSRFAARKNTDFVLQGVVTKREQYPLVQIGQTTTNYLLNTTSKTTNEAFDYLSGVVIKTSAIDHFGNAFVTETTPAYRVPLYSSVMGPGGKNMLTQVAGEVTYHVDPANFNNKLGVVSAGAQTWSDQIWSLSSNVSSTPQKQTGIWRQESQYSFFGDPSKQLTTGGFYPFSDFVPFNYTSGATNTLWSKNSTITFTDVFSHALEAIDMNGIYSAVRLDNNLQRVIATASNAKYREFNYSGIEEATVGATPPNIDFMSFIGTASTEAAHTGKNSMKRTISGQGGFSFTIPASTNIRAGKYKISAWVKTTDANVPKLAVTPCGASTTYISIDPTRKNGSWYLLEHVFDYTPGCSINIKGYSQSASVVYWDDIRYCRYEGAMSSYVYNEWGELSNIIDNNNMYTRFEYDDMGRLIKTFKETFTNSEVKLNETVYNYANQ